MAFTHALGHGLGGIVTSWATYALMFGGPCSLLLTQTAYQAGRPMITLPVVTVVTPMASLAVGTGLLGETTRLSTATAAAVAGAVLLTAVGLTVLARRAAHQDPAVASPAPSRPLPQAARQLPEAARQLPPPAGPFPEPARPRREPARPGHVGPRARQFLAGACVPAAGNISFWTVPASRPRLARPSAGEEHRSRSLAGCP